MFRSSLAAGLVLGVVLLMGGPATAATVDQVAGTVKINVGDGFKAITGPVQVTPGTAIMVEAGGSARILYANNCFVTVQPGTVITVVPDDQCVPVTSGSSLGVGQIGIGAAIIAGGVGAAFLLGNKSDHNKPASP